MRWYKGSDAPSPAANRMLAAYIATREILLDWTPYDDMIPVEHNLHFAISKLMWDTLHFVITLSSEMLFCIWIMSI